MRGALLRLRRSTLVAARSVCVPALAPAAPRVRSSSVAMAAAAAEDDLERAVGITGFVSDAPGFTAVLKHRWSDFVVNEIGLDGVVARLGVLPSAPPPRAAAELPVGAGEASGATSDAALAPAGDTGTSGGAVGEAAPAPADAAGAEAAAAAAAAALPALPPAPSPADDPSAALAAFAPLLSAADAAALRDWLAACASAYAAFSAPSTPSEPRGPPARAPQPLVLPATSDKVLRGQLHAAVRNSLPWADSDTVGEGADAKSVRIRARAFKRRRDADERADAGGGGGGGRMKRIRDTAVYDDGGVDFDASPYVAFTLCKENTDTGGALGVLGALLRCPPRALGFAGTKDRRGVTAQRCTWRGGRGAPGRLRALNGRLAGMRVGALAPAGEPLSLGDLRGNVFCITLRDVRATSPPADVAAACAGLRARGFLNFFGLQRFGAAAGARTHACGAALLRGDWAAAAAMLLAPRPGERADMAAARAAWAERGDAAAALKLLPVTATAERALLKCFAKAGHDSRNIVGALTAIPKTLRMMYVHAYQSYLWNHAAAERARLFGLDAAVEGDLIYDDYLADSDDLFAPAAGTARAGAQHGAGDDSDGDSDDEGEASEEASGRRVRHVTAAEAAARSVPITAVLLPLPAAGVAYPAHDVAEVYRRLSDGDGVALSGGQHAVREFSLGAFRGGYRRLLHRPGALTWQLRRYDDPGADLTRTDLADALAATGRRQPPGPDALPPPPLPCDGAAFQAAAARCAAAEAGDAAAAAELLTGQGRFLALQLSFALPPSCYATMLIRELLKSPTSADFHRGIGGHEGADAPAPAVADAAAPHA